MRHKLLIIAAAAILVKLLFFLSAFRGVTESSSSTCERCNYTKDQEMLDWIGGIFGSRTSAYCKHEFPQVWSDFLDCLVDSTIAQGQAIPAAGPKSDQAPSETVLPPVERLVAIGDLHGDMRKARRAFQLGGLIDEQDRWIGGTTTAVQVGDQLDRGDNELQILYWLERLQREAARAGGRLHVLLGNHETMNAAGRFNYATLPGLVEFYNAQTLHAWGAGLKAKCGCGFGGGRPEPPAALSARYGVDNTAAAAARREALSPGGPVTRRFLAPHPVVLQIGSTVFVHGGVLPAHAAYGVERINAETRAWLSGEQPRMPGFLNGRHAVVWARDYSTEDEARCDCAALQQALGMLPGAARMVVGHTIQDAGINAACGQRVYRIDVGLSKGCGNGEPEVLEILNDTEVRRLHQNEAPEVFGAEKAAAGEQRVPFWQWATGRQEKAEMA